MESYSVIKKNKIMKFSDKRVELEMIILSELTHSRKTNIVCFFSFVDKTFEPSDMCISLEIITDTRKLVRGGETVWRPLAWVVGGGGFYQEKPGLAQSCSPGVRLTLDMSMWLGLRLKSRIGS